MTLGMQEGWKVGSFDKLITVRKGKENSEEDHQKEKSGRSKMPGERLLIDISYIKKKVLEGRIIGCPNR
jgi:hypothetical protein